MATIDVVDIQIRSLRTLLTGSRMPVMRALRERRLTAAELAQRLGIQKSSAHKHLTKLAEAGFVERHEEGRLSTSTTTRTGTTLRSPRSRFCAPPSPSRC